MTDTNTKQAKDSICQKGRDMYYPNDPEGPEYGVIKLVSPIIKGWYRNGPFSLKP